MKVTIIHQNNTVMAGVTDDKVIITDVQSAMDLIMSVCFEHQCSRVILDKKVVCEEFFDLKTMLAGEILQKFVNYQVKVAIVGDFTAYSSTSLRDFIYESNKGRHIFFVPDEKQAIEKLLSA